MNTATTESTSGSSMAASRASSKSSAVASAPSATERADLQPDRGRGVGGQQPERVGVADHRDPRARAAAAGGRRSWATSNISSRVSTWITPAWRNIASTAACGARDRADRVAHRHALGGAAGLHRDDRLAPGDPAGDAG